MKILFKENEGVKKRGGVGREVGDGTERVSGNERAGLVTTCCLGHFTRLLFFIDVDFSV